MRIEYIIGGYDPNAAVSYLLTEKRLVRIRTDEKPGTEGVFLNLYLIINDHTADIRYQVAEVVVNGEKIALPVKYGRVDISSLARIGVNHISVTYTVGNRNLLGPLHYAGNEDAVGVFCFETFDFKKDEKGICQYKLCRFYKNCTKSILQLFLFLFR